jgi:LmbE family N-acetylglucosaminyl deacetylase
MTPLKLEVSHPRPLRLLCLGAHSDDIEIGCGGTLIRLLTEHPNCEVVWAVFSANAERAREAEKSAGIYLNGVDKKTIIIKEFRDSYFPYVGGAIKDSFKELVGLIHPDLIFTPHRNDLHQDHRLISELTWNMFRDHLILEYEILKYDGDLGSPNMFMVLEENACKEKVRRLMDCFESQKAHNSWFDEESFKALMRIRGVEANSPTKYAEAFYCRKLTLGF